MSSEGSPVLLRECEPWPRRLTASTRTQIGRFLLIGGSSVAIDLVVYIGLTDTWGPTAAKAISYVAGMLFGFVGNKFWTFESRRTSISEPMIYVLLYATTLAVNVGMNSTAIAILDNLYVPSQFSRVTAFIIATGATTVLNFLGLKFLTFRLANQLP